MREVFRHYLGGLYHRFGQHHVFLLAGGLAFSFLICIVPLVLVLLSVLGKALAASAFAYRIEVVIEMLFPAAQYTASLKNFLLARVDEIIRYRDVAGYGGAFGLLLAASGLFGSMRTILNKIFQVNKGKHPMVGKLRDFGMVLLVLLFVLTSTTIFPLLELMKTAAHKIVWLQTFFQNTSLQSLFPVFFFVVIFFLFFILYHFVPYEKLGNIPTAVSALVATIFWEIARQLFGYYLKHAAALDRVYGAYIFVVAVVLWIYYSSLMFILGAEIGQLYREHVPSGESDAAVGIVPLDL
jgi:membrane protein